MRHTRTAFVLALAIGLAVGAHSFSASVSGKCLVANTGTYYLTTTSDHVDYLVRVAEGMAEPDITMQSVESAEIADFILVDDGPEAAIGACRADRLVPGKSVKLVGSASGPGLRISLSAQQTMPDYKIHVRSTRFSLEEGAALFAAMVRSVPSRQAQRQ